ncbi:DUF192 domain-containing protein [Azoarcus sp. L1K30]|nr:DUF192 domain-containing protein [Azoarcus sp. L1K30]
MRREVGRVLRVGCVLAAWMPAMVGAQMPTTELGLGMFRIETEVAFTDQDRQLGLMNRKSMPLQHGMVFVFTQDARHCMWMKNTLLPLSVAFLDDKGRILNIEDMLPQTEDSHCAAGPARYALEMNQGWFRERGFKVGDAVRGIERLPAGR